jgi:hypothetical protein
VINLLIDYYNIIFIKWYRDKLSSEFLKSTRDEIEEQLGREKLKGGH